MLKIEKTENINFIDLPLRLINFARNFDIACILDSHSEIKEFFGNKNYNDYDLIAGFSNLPSKSTVITSFERLGDLDKTNNNWYLGYLSYDLKNNIEDLQSDLPDNMNWPEIFLFVPDILILKKGNSITYSFNQTLFPNFKLKEELSKVQLTNEASFDISFRPRVTKEEYIEKTEILKKHIARGDIYEVNFCQEFYANCKMNPYSAYLSLSQYSPSPFAAFLKLDDKFLMCASPERFLKRKGDLIISQPIKGTIKRSDEPTEDLFFKNQLESDIKERSENIMIVDLVRNDLSKIAQKGTVKVEELCEVYSFPQVHQMISTICAQLNTSSIKDIISATFPMGSMTGAPKIEAMKIIEKFESIKRGIYSGSVGYISPSGDFDFNVVIRSLQYNAEKNYVSYLAGSAITSLSDVDKEYEECILKTYAMKEAFKQPANV